VFPEQGEKGNPLRRCDRAKKGTIFAKRHRSGNCNEERGENVFAIKKREVNASSGFFIQGPTEEHRGLSWGREPFQRNVRIVEKDAG